MRNVERPSLGEWLAEEPYTLAMSSGFFGFYAHSGVLAALCERDLYPSATRGSSGGALATALWAAGMEPLELASELSSITREDFWDPSIGPGLLKGERLDSMLRSKLPMTSFEDCSVPVHVSVFDLHSRQTEVLDRGDLVLAVRASCAFPGLFQPVIIDGSPKLDGGIKDHAGYYGAPKSERIFHHNLGRKVRKNDAANEDRKNMQSLKLNNLPFVNPFQLYKGMTAYKDAYTQTMSSLSSPLPTAKQ